jgi:long-chain acyl-CoA synthetase
MMMRFTGSRATRARVELPQDPASTPLIQLFERRVRGDGDAVAFRVKELGIWREVTWTEFADHVECIALGFERLGIGPGDRIAMMSDPVPEWLYADMAAQSLGAIIYGLYVTTGSGEIDYLLRDADAKVFIVEDQEYVDRTLAIPDFPPGLGKLLVVDRKGMFAYDHPLLSGFEEVEAFGRAIRDEQPNRWKELIQSRHADEVIGLFYTSGTTGRPKGAMLTSKNVVSAWHNLFLATGEFPNASDRTVAHVPFAHVAERAFSLWMPVLYGSVAHLPEDMDTVREAMIEVNPTMLMGFPRMWETYASQVMVEVGVADRLKRSSYALAMRARRSLLSRVWSGGRVPVWSAAASWMAYWIMCRPILDKFGYKRLRFVLTGGASVSPDIVRLWQMWGVRMMEIYGMTECAGLITVQADRQPRPGVAGKPLPGIEVTLGEDGELLVRGDTVYGGYWGRPEDGLVQDDGWLHTGDIGEMLPDGNLRIIDRKKDILIMATGHVVPASETENIIKYSIYVRDAMLIGDGRPYLTALIEMDYENVSEWARSHGITYVSFSNLAQNPAVVKLIASEIDKANATLLERGKQAIKYTTVLPKELDPEEGDEVTATRKVKRRQLAQKFETFVNDMYRTEFDERVQREVSGRQ